MIAALRNVDRAYISAPYLYLSALLSVEGAHRGVRNEHGRPPDSDSAEEPTARPDPHVDLLLPKAGAREKFP
jgi:hypothetical protein